MGCSLALSLFVLLLNVNVTLSQPVGCSSPPPLENGDLKHNMKSQYSHNEQVEYMCQTYFTMEGDRFRTCKNGEWIGQTRCLKPCVVNEDDLNSRKIAFRYSDVTKVYSAHNDVIEFACAKRKAVGGVGMRQKCNDGVMDLPTCQ